MYIAKLSIQILDRVLAKKERKEIALRRKIPASGGRRLEPPELNV